MNENQQKANEKKTVERELRITKEHNVGIIETYREIALSQLSEKELNCQRESKKEGGE